MTADQNTLATAAATALSMRLGAPVPAPVGERPLALAWRARRAAPAAGEADTTRALLVVRADAPEAERRRYVEGGARILALGEPPAGVLRVHAVGTDAVVTDLWTLGSACDLGALGWNASRRVAFVRTVAEALEALHRAGIVHGCLCEENVLLDDDLRPVLAEAGAVSVHALSERGGDAASYAAFASPEVLAGADADPRSDVFSLGRLLQHVLRSDDQPQAAEIVRRCVASSPAGRYPTAAAVAGALEGLAAALGPQLQPAALVPRSAPASAKSGSDDEQTVPLVPRSSSASSAPPDALPSWTAPAGTALAITSVVVASLGFGSSPSVQTALTVALACGVAMAASALRPDPKTSPALRALFAFSAAALVVVADPLAYAYRAAAERALRASPEARRVAVEQIVRLGRDFQNMSLAGVDLTGTDLRGADLRGADLSRCDLSGVDLRFAMLGGASLVEARLPGADLRQTDLSRARIESTVCDARTRLPDPYRCAAGVVSDAPAPAVSTAPAPAPAAVPAGAPSAQPPALEAGPPPR